MCEGGSGEWRRAGGELVNMYGITETTVHVTYRRVRAEPGKGSGIGKGIEDLEVYVLDEWRSRWA